MKKIILLFITALFIQSCIYDEIDYHGATKEVFEGVLTDPAGNPLEGIKVSAYLSNGSDADIPGYDFTDSNGKYKFVFPGVSKFDSDEDFYVALLVNQERYTEARDNRYSSFTIHNIKLDRMDNHKIDFGTSALFDTEDATSLSINFVASSPTAQRPAVNLLGMVNRNFIDYNQSLLDVYEYYFDQADFTVAKNQVITLLYQPYNPDGSPGAIEEVDIAIGEGPVTYTLTY
jgi:hypothetical protein